MHHTAQPCHQLTTKARVFLRTTRLWDVASSAPFSKSRKLLGSMHFLPLFSSHFMSLSTLTIRLPLVSGSKALPFWEMLGLSGGLQSTHPPIRLQSADPAIKREGHREYLPPLTASKLPNGNGQSNPATTCGDWLLYNVCAKSRVSEPARGHLAGVSPLPKPRVAEAILHSHVLKTSFLRTQFTHAVGSHTAYG